MHRARWICVLRSGGQYTPEWVRWMLNGIRRTTDSEAELACLTDHPSADFCEGVRPIPLHHRWPGWWAKTELFRPDLFPGERVVYIDLDVLVTGDISTLSEAKIDFIGSRPRFPEPGAMNSSVMAFQGGREGLAQIYSGVGWKEIGYYEMQQPPWKGDQGYISSYIRDDYTAIQDLVRTALWKRDGFPEGTRLLYFSGEPSPIDCPDEKVQRYMQ